MIRVVPWSASAADVLSAVDALDLSVTQTEVESGVSQLWQFDDNGFAVTKLRRADDGSIEWIWVAGAGTGFMKYAPILLNAARERNITCWVMVHNPAMRRMYQRLGFIDHHFVLRSP